MRKHVWKVETKTSSIFYISEPGGQSRYKSIQMSLDEAKDIFLELADILEEEELRQEPRKENYSNQ